MKRRYDDQKESVKQHIKDKYKKHQIFKYSNQKSNIANKKTKCQKNPEVRLLYPKCRYQKNPENKMICQKARHQENCEKQVKHQKRRYKENPVLQIKIQAPGEDEIKHVTGFRISCNK